MTKKTPVKQKIIRVSFQEAMDRFFQSHQIWRNFVRVIAEEAFDDLRPALRRQRSDAEEYTAEEREAQDRIKAILGDLPISEPEAWIDAVNQQFSLNIPMGSRVDDDLAIRIGNAIRRERLISKGNASGKPPAKHNRSADEPKPRIAAKGKPGRRSNPEKALHAVRANELRSQVPQPLWKDVTEIINTEFGLTGKSKYAGDQLRLLHKGKFSNKKRG